MIRQSPEIEICLHCVFDAPVRRHSLVQRRERRHIAPRSILLCSVIRRRVLTIMLAIPETHLNAQDTKISVRFYAGHEQLRRATLQLNVVLLRKTA